MTPRLPSYRDRMIAAMLLLAAAGCTRGQRSTPAPAESRGGPPAAAKSDQGKDATPQPAAERRSLSIATYNINCGNVRLAEVVEAIRRADADVVCLQETNAASARVLRREFARRYPEIRFYGAVRPYPAGGFGMLSTLPIQKERFVPPEHGLFGAPIVDVRFGGETIQIVNVHLNPTLLPEPTRPAGFLAVMAAFEEAEQTHRSETEHLLSQLRPDMPTIIAGDFNSGSSMQAPSLLGEKGFVDSFAAVHDDSDEHPTWRWRTRYGKAALRIDYIFHSSDFRTAESQVIPTEGSDHFLLLTRLESHNHPPMNGASRQEYEHDRPEYK